MKFALLVVLLLLTGLSLSVSTTATTLKLSPDIDLMMIDGRRITGSLLKGAESLELDAGQHQLLFKVTKAVHKNAQTQVIYSSSPLIVVFNSQDIKAVAIVLPRIETICDGRSFDKLTNYQVIDQNGRALNIKTDVLHVTRPFNGEELERTVAAYNSQNHKASVPELSNLPANAMGSTELR
ncbi:DUF2057 family protein [Serratia microhaemolytica]|uniref:DUF2057 family protein n=1 Tax=Serratia microhaemolytica TaxID=2675110 RepID=UPI000FDD96BA|nr:DUF2057 family protein [Serratia microhaemolytica]